jgi:hypothetical protein
MKNFIDALLEHLDIELSSDDEERLSAKLEDMGNSINKFEFSELMGFIESKSGTNFYKNDIVINTENEN